MIKAAAYIRVSTDEQTEFSPSAQKRAIFNYAQKNNITINKNNIYIDEGISGRTAQKRIAFMQMIADAKQKPQQFSIIIVHKFDRFARSREDSVVYKSLLKKECNIRVISVTEQFENDKFSIILEAMLEAMAEYYSLNLADEVKKGLFEKANRGEHIGRAPYGYTLQNKTLVPNEFEFLTVKRIFDLYTKYNFSYSQISNYLNTNNIPTKLGNKWRACTINYILSNHVYIGYTRYNYFPHSQKHPNLFENCIIKKSNHIPVIDEETFKIALKKQSLKNNFYSKSPKIVSIIQNLVFCENCDKRLILKKSGNGYYSCLCPNCKKSVSLLKAEKFVYNIINNSDIFYNPNNINNFNYNDSLYIKSALKNIDKKLNIIKKAYISGADTLEEYTGEKKRLLNLKKEYILKLKIQKSEPNNSFTVKEILNNDTINIDLKNSIIQNFIKKICVNLDTKTFKITL